ncbi:hypothetical protein GCM10009602_53170 [Nocardiopsis tropica]
MKNRARIVFFDESGVWLLSQVRRTHAPRGRTLALVHRLNWKRASMAAAPGHHSADPGGGTRLCLDPRPVSYDTEALIRVLEQLRAFYEGENVVLVWGGLSAHRSRAMRAWVDGQGLAHAGATARLCPRAQPRADAVVVRQGPGVGQFR